ncbi:hypothetical protein JDV02_002420 [Purpureocillium takamizusanense]|uniref:Kinesin motor domain-containing protein n=1 Tax=Purpureocillium takamizusanense TaxID=2060973 RepID=A0A9Q8V8T2_9HYPO|nr:uncharacterized protein JDV02_002420 [Purpureocillium takamizusanense]UNI15936.1 hypothetical protein JDV02_002420 [Purpureocillium takamizusanense]
MEDFYIEHADRFRALIKRVKLEPPRQPAGGVPASRDISVVARIRPPAADENDFPEAIFARATPPGTIDAHELRKAVRGPPVLKSSVYNVDRVYGPDATTEAIYDDVVRELVPWSWGGGISTLFAYGQTGSGKTYSISGLEKLVAEALMGGSLGGERKVYLSIVELAGNASFDLLNQRKAISILEDAFGVTQLAGALEHHVQSTAQVLSLIETATELRRTEATAKNDSSSRSHAICRLRIEIPSMPTAEDGIFYLIDLAGSEGARDKQDHSAERMRESRAINVSLSVLKDCIRGKTEHDNAVATGQERKKSHVPFRQNQLTKVLKHVFDPAGTRACKTVVLTCINPCLADVHPGRNSLRFAEMLRVFVPTSKKAEYDASSPITWNNDQLRTWIDANSGSPAISSEILAPVETGAQLLRLPAPEFELRCLKTEGVTPEQAAAFRSKVWQTHVDAQRSRSKASSRSGAAAEGAMKFPDSTGELLRFAGPTSMEPQAEIRALDFKKRVRPGMVVAWTPPEGCRVPLADGLKLALVLCPAASVGDHGTIDAKGDMVSQSDEANKDADGNPAKYLCALVNPGIMSGAYDISMWRQFTVDLAWMDKEVLLEYDSATRFYYIAV